MSIDKVKLDQLREQLPQGANKEIAEILGLSPNYVSNVLNGAYFNLSVIEKAIQIRDSYIKSIKKLENKV
jgi:transcriptional regulator with XRE-family HTH domain